MTFYNYLMRHRAPVEKDDATRLANLVFQDPLFPKPVSYTHLTLPTKLEV